MASLAEMEHELMMEKNRAGLLVVHQLDRKSGRKRKMTDSEIESAKAILVRGIPPKNLVISAPTLYRWLPTLNLS